MFLWSNYDNYFCSPGLSSCHKWWKSLFKFSWSVMCMSVPMQIDTYVCAIIDSFWAKLKAPINILFLESLGRGNNFSSEFSLFLFLWKWRIFPRIIECIFGYIKLIIYNSTSPKMYVNVTLILTGKYSSENPF